MSDIVPLWVPSRGSIDASPMYAFMQRCNAEFGLSLETYPQLHAWSIAEREKFWTSIWAFCEV